MLSRLFFPDMECVSISVENDSLLVNGTARLIQSRDGRLAILSFRGTSPFDPIAWLGNFSMPMDPFHEAGNVHGGFNRTLSAMFPEIDDLLVSAGLPTQADIATPVLPQSIIEAWKSADARIHPLPETMPLDLVRRYQLLKTLLTSDDSLLDLFKNALQGELGLEDEGSEVRAAHDDSSDADVNALLTDPSGACERFRSGKIRAAVSSILDDLGPAAPGKLKALFENERQRRLQNEVQKIIDRSLYEPERKPLERLYITGHSLGGALAVLAAAYLYRAHPDAQINKVLGGVYTFGQPMVGDAAFAASCDRDFGPLLFRHIFHNDIVPHWPPRTAGSFAHAGTEYASRASGWMKQDGQVSQAFSLVESLPVSLIAFIIEQFPVLDELIHEAPLVSAITHLAPFQYSIADHLPLKYLRCSMATRPGSELIGSLTRRR